MLRLIEYFHSEKKLIIVTDLFKGTPIIKYFQKKKKEYVLKTILFIFREVVKTINVG